MYAVWSDDTDIYYSFSNSLGTRWSPAIKVTQNTSQAGKSNVFPWVTTDANGHVAIAWYGADKAGNSNTIPLTTNWNVFVAEIVNGHAITPVFTLSQATVQELATKQAARATKPARKAAKPNLPSIMTTAINSPTARRTAIPAQA